MQDDLELAPDQGTRRRRPLLVSIASAAVVLGLVALAGIFAVATDTAHTGENRYATDEFAERPDADLQIAAAGPDGSCGEFTDNLMTGLIDFTESDEETGTSSTICLRNAGGMGLWVSMAAIDVLSTDPECTSREAEADETCGDDQAGELEEHLLIEVRSESCNREGELTAAGMFWEFEAAARELVELAPDDEVAFCVRASTNDESPSRAAQSDELTWRFAFAASTEPPLCVQSDDEPNDAPDWADLMELPVLTIGTLCGQDFLDNFRVQHVGGVLDVWVTYPEGFIAPTLTVSEEHGSFAVGGIDDGAGTVRVREVFEGGPLVVRVSGSYPEEPLEYGLSIGSVAECDELDAEDNDSILDAVPLVAGEAVIGSICPADDDWYSIEHAGGFLDVTLDFEHDLGDLDLALFDSEGLLRSSSETISDQERISGTYEAGTYYVRVFGFDNAPNPSYQLVWAAAP